MSTDTDFWPFDADADRDDPLTALRIAVTGSHPTWSYLVAFDRESAARPTETETTMLVAYLDEYKDRWYGDNGFRRRMEERALDVDGGANGVVFHKFDTDDWGYRRRSFTQGWLWSVLWPGVRDNNEYQGHELRGPFSLEQLMDRLHSIASDEPSARWLEWKAARPEVFA